MPQPSDRATRSFLAPVTHRPGDAPMSRNSWIRKVFGTRTSPIRNNRHLSVKPSLLAFEDRITPTIAITSISANPAGEGDGIVQVTVTRTGSGSKTVDFTTGDGTA